MKKTPAVIGEGFGDLSRWSRSTLEWQQRDLSEGLAVTRGERRPRVEGLNLSP